MCLVGLLTGFLRTTLAQVIVVALLSVRVDNEVAPPGVARTLALEA